MWDYSFGRLGIWGTIAVTKEEEEDTKKKIDKTQVTRELTGNGKYLNIKLIGYLKSLVFNFTIV